MAINQTAGGKKAGPAKQAGAEGGSAKKVRPKKVGSTTREAPPKKAVRPKLAEPQKAMLEKVRRHTVPAGYLAEKKPENKTLEALLKHKLVKKGKKHEGGSYHYLISNAGKKHKPIWEVFQEITATIPDEEWAKLPVDGAEQHDHYIYGVPKRRTS
jgi:hypothetical protein